MGLMASEVGIGYHVGQALAGLLHDIGKAVNHEIEEDRMRWWGRTSSSVVTSRRRW